jgi:maltooligosyltrehalose trehalohydrolase
MQANGLASTTHLSGLMQKIDHLPPGAHVSSAGTSFVAYATKSREVLLRLLDDGKKPSRDVPLAPLGDGFYGVTLADVQPGALYNFVLDGDEVPDPYARWLPFGVHGPAAVCAPAQEPALPAPPPLHQWTIYELHVGTFSPEGTYQGVAKKLDHLVALGVSAIELLPVAAFAGSRGWGYDGVALFAPFAPYGAPEDLRALIRAAHDRGIAVILDVVYNHLGPSGNYLSRYSDEYFNDAVQTAWGAAPDFSLRPMRNLVLENARYWLTEFGFDALRLDATHALVDRASQRHIVAEIADLAHALSPRRLVFIEDERNDPHFVRETGVDAVWADDLHHQIHVLLTKESDGYYGAYAPTAEALAQCIRQGWTFCGQPYAPWKGRPRGAPATALRPEALVTAVQNHDQVGNRAFGTRLSHDVGVDRYAMTAILLLFLPTTPLLFMGQEWAASSPFLFFTDHEGDLGRAVTEGRQKEFESFAAFRDPEAARAIPDPQAQETFERSRLRWDECGTAHHRSVLAMHREMLNLRKNDPVLSLPTSWNDIEAVARDNVLEVVRKHRRGERRLIVNFAEEAAPVAVSSRSRVVVVWGRFEGGQLSAPGALLLAD